MIRHLDRVRNHKANWGIKDSRDCNAGKKTIAELKMRR